jgi:hypothetical protein
MKVDSMYNELGEKLEALLQREHDPFTAQDVLLNVINKIRMLQFEEALKLYMDQVNIASMVCQLSSFEFMY